MPSEIPSLLAAALTATIRAWYRSSGSRRGFSGVPLAIAKAISNSSAQWMSNIPQPTTPRAVWIAQYWPPVHSYADPMAVPNGVWRFRCSTLGNCISECFPKRFLAVLSGPAVQRHGSCMVMECNGRQVQGVVSQNLACTTPRPSQACLC